MLPSRSSDIFVSAVLSSALFTCAGRPRRMERLRQRGERGDVRRGHRRAADLVEQPGGIDRARRVVHDRRQDARAGSRDVGLDPHRRRRAAAARGSDDVRPARGQALERALDVDRRGRVRSRPGDERAAVREGDHDARNRRCGRWRPWRSARQGRCCGRCRRPHRRSGRSSSSRRRCRCRGRRAGSCRQAAGRKRRAGLTGVAADSTRRDDVLGRDRRPDRRRRAPPPARPAASSVSPAPCPGR